MLVAAAFWFEGEIEYWYYYYGGGDDEWGDEYYFENVEQYDEKYDCDDDAYDNAFHDVCRVLDCFFKGKDNFFDFKARFFEIVLWRFEGVIIWKRFLDVLRYCY